jgi:hypothetical protein
MIDHGLRNTTFASMAKLFAGASNITQLGLLFNRR